MRLWDDDEWSNFCKSRDHGKVREALEGRGFKVRGFCNGKPELDGVPNWYDVQTIITDALAGKVVSEKPPISTVKPKAKGRGK
jgi:hypothetical protein